jgi:hypothetical protein
LITTVGDHTYRVNLWLQLYGPEYRFISPYDFLDATSIVLALLAGDYTAYLERYELELETEEGFVPVSSNLISSYYVDFTIHNQSTTTISFQFETDGVIVTVGSGNLIVDVGVTETTPYCTPLGDDCGEGWWCAPPELTGQPLACLPSGTVELGESCTSPRDCVGNSSCFDFGAGAVCGALCLAGGFGEPCESGGTCIQSGIAYGVCVPEGGTPPTTGGGGGGSGGEGGFGGEGSGVGGMTSGGFPAGGSAG